MIVVVVATLAAACVTCWKGGYQEGIEDGG